MKHTDHLLEKYVSTLKILPPSLDVLDSMLSWESRPYTQSTTHPFLEAAGDGSLDKETFTRWLRQDYLYAHEGYTRFASILLSGLPYPTALEPASDLEHNLARAKRLLIGSLSNIQTEVDLFIETAKEHNLDLFIDGQLPASGSAEETGLLGPYESPTRSYIEFMITTAATGTVEEGLLSLWAMEKAFSALTLLQSYLDAWTYASQHIPTGPAQDDTQKAIRKLIANWTSDEFKAFVKDCEEVYEGMKVDPESDTGKRCEDVFKRVVWLEQRFWPSV